MTAQSAIAAPARNAAADGWQAHLVALGAVAAAILVLYARDAADMAVIWWTSSTYNHCALVPPIVAWLVWQRAPELRRLRPTVWLPGLAGVAAGALLWLLGDAGSIALARHLGLVVMLQGAVVVCLGKSVAKALIFPLFYALFTVPAGEELVPLLQTVTASMCMSLLALVGIPAHLDGIFITTPHGYFEVAEACSGVKFLVAMVAYGALVANVCFRSPVRRAMFMLAAVAIPILANGIRAWGTIYIASVTGSDFASGVDHVVYGWLFFAVVIALLMAAGWPFFDRTPGERWLRGGDVKSDGGSRSGSPWPAVLAAGLIAAAAPAWSSSIASSGVHPVPKSFELPEVAGWTRVPATGGRAWQPHFAGADALRIGRYRDETGRQVDLAVAVYARQSEGRELVGYGQGAVGPDSDWAWTATGSPPPQGRLDRLSSHGVVREVATFYRIGEIVTGRPLDAKLATIKTRLLGGPQRAVAVLISAEAAGGSETPRPAIDAFLLALGPIAPLADRAAGLPGRR